MSGPGDVSHGARTERLIGVARLGLATGTMIALAIDPSEPARYAGLMRALTVGYTAWALVVLSVARSMALTRRGQLATHAVDLGLCSLFMGLTLGAESPFFLYLAFALTAGTVRWDAPGALWTGGLALVVFLGTASFDLALGHPLETNVFLVRATYLAVLTLMLAYLGRYGARAREVSRRLGAWQPVAGVGLADLMGQACRYVGEVVGAPRAVAVWEDPEEPDLRMAWWADGRVSISRDDAGAFQPLVARPFQGTDFLCRDARTPESPVVARAPLGLRTAPGPAVHPRFVERFGVRTVLAVECRLGWLLVLDKKPLTDDDLSLAQIAARQVSASLDQALLRQRLEETRVLEVAGRLGRDLHDGVLQALTAITLRLQTIGRGVDAATLPRIESLQAMIGDEARRLRGVVQELTSGGTPAATEVLADRLEELGRHIERDWDLRVEITVEGLERIPREVTRDVYFVVREALTNAARHAGASMAKARLAAGAGRLRITISDDGHGFPFEGRRAGHDLVTANLAPRMLYARVVALGGRLVVESGTDGSLLDIEVPLAETRGAGR